MLNQENEHLPGHLRFPVVHGYFRSFSRGENVATDNSETYEKLLDSSLGLSNPLNVDYLLGKLGINGTQTPSLMRGLQRYILACTLVISTYVVLLFSLKRINRFFYIYTVNASKKMISQWLFGRSNLCPGL